MNIQVKENKVLKERIYVNTLSSGTKCYIIPKSGFHEKQAIVSVRYGSNDISFKSQNKTGKPSPEGVAHFLEHKLFEEEWGNAFEEFSKNGAQANAFTDCNKTAYYFSCDDGFEKNFESLLNFVQSPYFTDESADREKGIISQEITMFDDDPNWKVYFNMLKAMYHNHPVKINIAGSVDSIKEIDAEVLHQCYRSFYVPENMTIVCVGDIEPEKIMKQAEQLMKKNGNHRAITDYQKESQSIVKNYVEESMDISVPVFHIGYKGKPMEPKPQPKKIYGMKMLLDLIAGESSGLYQSLYDHRLTDEPFGLQYLYGSGFSFSVFMGSSEMSEDIADKINLHIGGLKKSGISEEDFKRLKKKHIGRFVRGFNSVNAICMSQIDNGVKGFDLIDAFEALQSVTKNDLENLLEEEFDSDKQVVSVIKKTKSNTDLN